MEKNKRYSLLIVAMYCYSGHVKAVIDHLLATNPLVEVTLLTDEADKLKNKLADKSVKVECYNVPPVRHKNRWLRFIIIKHRQCNFFRLYSKGKRFDIVNVHFPKRFMLFVVKYLRKMSNNIVITPWGSDVLRQKDKKTLDQLGRLYRKADYIATSTKTPLGKMIIEAFNVDPARMIGNFFGSDVVDYALKDGSSITTEEAKERFGLMGKYVITCGYNKREPQRHKVIINAIGQVRSRLPVNITLLFPMTYGNHTRDEYIEECRKECSDRNLPSVFVTDFLSVKDVFLLRKATDMFVHVQTTDASSGSVMEYILCDKKIVHGSWIKYEELESYRPLFYYPVNRLEDLGEIIVNAFYAEKIAIPQEVMEIVKNCGWERKASQMNEFFMSIAFPSVY